MLRIAVSANYLAISTLACALLLADGAHGSISASFDSYDPGASWGVSLDGVGYNTNEAGIFHWSGQTPSVPDLVNGVIAGNHVGGGSNFISVCIELTQTISYGQQNNLTIINPAIGPKPGSAGSGPPANSSPMGALAAARLADLWFNYLDDALLNATNRAAFQLAVWKLTYDEANATNGFNLLAGRLTATSGNAGSVFGIAETWLTSINPATLGTLAGSGASTKLGALTKLDPPDNLDGTALFFQDQLVEFSAPEPKSMVIWGLIAGGIGLVSVRRQKCRGVMQIASGVDVG